MTSFWQKSCIFDHLFSQSSNKNLYCENLLLWFIYSSTFQPLILGGGAYKLMEQVGLNPPGLQV